MKMKTKVLAVLTLALLMINMAPVMRAEAAEDTLTVNWNGQEVYLPLGNWPYYVVVRDKSGSGFDAVYLSFDKLEILSPTASNGFYGIGIYDDSGNMDKSGNMLRMYGYDLTPDILESYYDWYGFTFETYRIDSSRVFSNYDVCDALTGEVVYEANSEPEYENIYSATGPVAVTWSADISNLMRFVGTELDDVDDLYVKSNWEAKYDDWFHRIIFRLDGELPALAGSSPTDGNMYKLYTESVIVFPSKDIVTGWISSGMSPVELYNDKGQANWFQTVYDGKNTFVKVKVTSESVPYYHSLMNGSHLFQVDIPMTNVIASVNESFDGGLRGYYGLSQEMWNLWKNSVYSYVLPYEIYTVLYAKEDVDTMVYGNMHYSVPNWTDIDPLGKGYVFTGGVIEKPLEDITDEDKKEIQMDTTREELAKRTEELEQLKKEYAESLKMNGSDEDVFELFGNFTSGLRSSSASFKNVATAVGNVFAFFPEDITGLLYGGIIVMIVIAIVKAIRG